MSLEYTLTSASLFECTILERVCKADVLLLLHRSCCVLQHPGGRVVPRLQLIDPQVFEILNQVGGPLPKRPTVQGAAPPLQQKQLIKGLQTDTAAVSMHLRHENTRLSRALFSQCPPCLLLKDRASRQPKLV